MNRRVSSDDATGAAQDTEPVGSARERLLASWLVMGLVTAAVAWAAIGHDTAPVPLLERDVAAELQPLEAKVGADPSDPAALASLSERYLAHDEPGLATAALTRAPELASDQRVADARVRTWMALGLTEQALGEQRAMLARCDASESCSRTVRARGELRLERLVALRDGGRDGAEPELALRLVSRVGHLRVD